MFHCQHCWENPCACGENYHSWSEERLKEKIEMLQKILQGKQAVREAEEVDRVKKLTIVTEPYS